MSRIGSGKIIEIQQRSPEFRQAIIQCQGIKLPEAGQYMNAHRPADSHKPAGVTLFPSGLGPQSFPGDQILTAPGIPEEWRPGDELKLRGPLGRGFHLPSGTGRIALGTFGTHSEHLLPLAEEILSQSGEVALFTDGDFSNLPTRIEVNKLDDLGSACRWADLLACAIPVEMAEDSLAVINKLGPIRCPTQVLIYGQFTCGGIAACAICAIRTPRNKIVMPCQDGPVFDWQKLN